ncbi:MAG: hypothetical protein ACYC5O_00580 [Anaerolineae bacterium]
MATGEVARLMVTIGADVREMNQGIASAQQGIQKFNSTASTLLGAGGLAGTLAVAGQAINQALEFGEAGARLQNLENSFNGFAQSTGLSGAAVLEQMQAMSQGMMSESQLMEQYNRAFLLAGADMANSMPKIIQLAQASSAAGMGDVDYLVGSMVTGIGRLSPMILDNLGLTVSLEQAYSDYAATMGRSASSLTKAEQQQAVLNNVMTQAEAKYGDLDAAARSLAGGGIAQLHAAWNNLMEDMQKQGAGPIDDVAEWVAKQLRAGTEGTEEWQSLVMQQLRGASGQKGAFFEDAATRNSTDWQQWANSVDVTRLSVENFNTALGILMRNAPEVAHQIILMRNAEEDMARQNEQLASAATHTGLTLSDEARKMLSLANQADAATMQVQKFADRLARIPGARDIYLRLHITEDSHTLSGAEYGGAYVAGHVNNTMAYLGELKGKTDEAGKDLEGLMDDMARASGSAFDSMKTQMQDYYSSWQSSAAGITGPTTPLDITQMRDESGLHKDTFDENVQRAKDVYNLGAASPWAGQLGFSDKASAIQYIEDFYGGRLGEDQYNWQAGIDQYVGQMQQQVGGQNLQAMFQEQLAAAGFGPDNPMIASALGDPLGIAGTDAAGLFGENFATRMGAIDFRGPAETAAQSVLAGWVSGMKSPEDTTLKSLFGLLWPLIERAIRGMQDL